MYEYHFLAPQIEFSAHYFECSFNLISEHLKSEHKMTFNCLFSGERTSDLKRAKRVTDLKHFIHNSIAEQ